MAIVTRAELACRRRSREGDDVTRELSVKQQIVCDLITRGLSNKEIARQIGITFRTVEYHRQAIYRKMAVRNAVELVRKMLGAE